MFSIKLNEDGVVWNSVYLPGNPDKIVLENFRVVDFDAGGTRPRTAACAGSLRLDVGTPVHLPEKNVDGIVNGIVNEIGERCVWVRSADQSVHTSLVDAVTYRMGCTIDATPWPPWRVVDGYVVPDTTRAKASAILERMKALTVHVETSEEKALRTVAHRNAWTLYITALKNRMEHLAWTLVFLLNDPDESEWVRDAKATSKHALTRAMRVVDGVVKRNNDWYTLLQNTKDLHASMSRALTNVETLQTCMVHTYGIETAHDRMLEAYNDTYGKFRPILDALEAMRVNGQPTDGDEPPPPLSTLSDDGDGRPHSPPSLPPPPASPDGGIVPMTTPEDGKEINVTFVDDGRDSMGRMVRTYYCDECGPEPVQVSHNSNHSIVRQRHIDAMHPGCMLMQRKRGRTATQHVNESSGASNKRVRCTGPMCPVFAPPYESHASSNVVELDM